MSFHVVEKKHPKALNSRLSEMNALIREIQQINTQQSEKLSTTLTKNIDSLLESNEKKLDQMRQANMEQNEKISSALTQNLKALQESTEKKLEQMRESAHGKMNISMKRLQKV